MRVSLGTPEIPWEAQKMVHAVLESGRLSYGPYSKSLEEEFASHCNHRYGVLSNSGTSSLHVALLALKEKYNWGPHAKVIVPATTFVASYNAVRHAGLKPVLVDVNPERWDFDFHTIHDVYDSDVVAVMAVNLFGKPSQLKSIRKFCNLLGLVMIEDSCEAVGALHHGKPVGSYGDVSVFSFYMGHLIEAGVGGIAVTSDHDVALLMRSYVNHGLSVTNLPENFDSGFLGRNFVFDRIGHSYRITEMEAAIALFYLQNIGSIVATRRWVASKYDDHLRPLIEDGFISVAKIGAWETSSWMMYPAVVLKESKHGLMKHLRENDIECRDMVPLTNQPCYRSKYYHDWDEFDFPVAKYLNNHGIYFGCHQDLNESHVMYVADRMREYFINEH